jgi:pimeloyl-ACP methyl ester carboxylesterase
MATFVLVHGSWAGGWIWSRLRPSLEEAGHRVLTPTLTGLGERHHLTGPEVGLGVHAQDIAAVLRWEDLEDVILVGHSYGGMVVTGAAALAPERIGQVAYIDAFAPVTGESAFDQLPWLKDAFVAAEGAPEWEVAPLDPGPLGADPESAGWLSSRMTPMPRLTHAEPLGPGSEKVLASKPVTYIHCAGQPLFDEVALSVVRRGFRVVTLAGVTHADPVTRPETVTAELLSLG